MEVKYSDRPFKDKTINVHFIPFSKVNNGFRKNNDETYSGVNNGVQHTYVEQILTSVIEALASHPDRTFAWSEIKYLHMFYVRAEPEMK